MARRETCPPSQLPTPATAETRAVPHGTHLSVSSWDHVQLHPMGNALGSCLWRGQQRFDEENLSPFQEPSRREAWGDVHACPTRSPFPATRVVMERGMLLSDPAGGASPAVGAPFGENFGSACLRWSRLTGTCLHRIAKSALCAVRSLLLPQVQQCSSFLPGSY